MWSIQNESHNFNEYAFRFIGVWFNWSISVLVLFIVLASYSSLLLLLALCHLVAHEPLKLHWIHKILLFLTAVIVSLFITYLDLKFSEQWNTICISLKVTAPFIHIGVVLGFSFLAWLVTDIYYRTQKIVFKVLVVDGYLAVMVVLFLIPLVITNRVAPPCLKSQIPPKPLLVGHRGAPMLAPENTILSYEKAQSCEVTTFESDVIISSDGVPFLMHDQYLKRTTDVATVFENRTEEDASLFTWAELQLLNTGEWYLKKDPFCTVSSFSPEEKEIIRQQKIPALVDLLKTAKKYNKSIIFDLRKPPANHAYNSRYINLTVETILNSTINPELILWLHNEDREKVVKMAPRFQQIFGDKEPIWDNAQRINFPFNNISATKIEEFLQKNVFVNLFVVDKPWLFSIFWCANVSSVTTNACHIFKEMKAPVWYLPPDTYMMIWILTDCVSFFIMLSLFLLQRCCSRRMVKEVDHDNEVLLQRLHQHLA